MTNYNHPSTVKQRATLLKALHEGPINTIYARESLGIAHPAGRVCELRASGLTIHSYKEWEQDSSGARHLVAKYVLGAQHV